MIRRKILTIIMAFLLTATTFGPGWSWMADPAYADDGDEATVEEIAETQDKEEVQEEEKASEDGEAEVTDEKSEEEPSARKQKERKAPESVNATELQFEGKAFSVELTCDDKANLPAETELTAEEIKDSSKTDEDAFGYKDYYEKALKAVQKDAGHDKVAGFSFAKFYDITLSADGEELEPAAPVDVNLSFEKGLPASKVSHIRIVHLTETRDGKLKAEVLDKKAVDAAVMKDTLREASFQADSFSVYGIVYTVDFHNGDYTFSIQGESSVLLSKVFQEIAIEQDMAEITDVTFSDESLVKVEPVSKEAIGTAEADWKLTSLKPFSSNEILTVRTTEREFEVAVTDDQFVNVSEDDIPSDRTVPIKYHFANGAVVSGKTLSLQETILSGRVTANNSGTRSKINASPLEEKLNTALGISNLDVTVGGVYVHNNDTGVNTQVNYVFQGKNGRYYYSSYYTDTTKTEKATIITNVNNNNYMLQDNEEFLVYLTLNQTPVYHENGNTYNISGANVTAQLRTVDLGNEQNQKSLGSIVEIAGVPFTRTYAPRHEIRLKYLGLVYSLISDSAVKVVGYDTDYNRIPQIPTSLSYNGGNLIVEDLTFFGSDGNLRGKHILFTEDMLNKMSDGAEIRLPEIVTQFTDEMKKAVEGYVSGKNNGESSGTRNVWKKAEYNSTTNKIEYTLKYLQLLKQDQPLDFIFSIDQTITMCDADATAYGVKAPRVMWMMALLQKTSYSLVKNNNNGYDTRVAFVPWGSTATKSAFLRTNSDIDNWFSGTETYSHAREGTDHSKAAQGCVELANTSIGENRTPVVIYMSDFQANAHANRNNGYVKTLRETKTYNTYAINVFADSSAYGKYYQNSGVYYTSDPAEFMGIFNTIIEDAIGYFLNKPLTVTDDLSASLGDKTPDNGLSDGPLASSTGRAVWSLGQQEPLMTANTLYSTSFNVQLEENAVYSGAMHTNESLVVKEDGREVNIIDAANSPILKKDLTLQVKTAGETAKSVSGAEFELKDSNGNVLLDDLTSDDNGVVTIPYEKVKFPAGSTYTLRQTKAGDEGVLPGGHWTLSVGSDYKITAETSQGAGQVNRTHDLQAVRGCFVVKNDLAQEITYDANSGHFDGNNTHVETVEYARGEAAATYPITNAKPTREGYQFLGWSENRFGFGTMYTKASEPFTMCRRSDNDDKTFYALWKYNGAVCKITGQDGKLLYYKDGGEYKPAVFKQLEDAISNLGNLYKDPEGKDKYQATAMNVEMLQDTYELPGTVTLKDYDITLKSASKEAEDIYSYEGTAEKATILAKADLTKSMFQLNSGSLTVENVTIDGNKDGGRIATEYGAGIYMTGANTVLTLKNGAVITGNAVSSEVQDYGAGVYMANGQIRLSGSATIFGNTTSNGMDSNLHLFGITNLHVDGDLTGNIGICNAGAKGSQFGVETQKRNGLENITDDVRGMYGEAKADDVGKIVWHFDPVCQLVEYDENGNMGEVVRQYGSLYNGAVGVNAYTGKSNNIHLQLLKNIKTTTQNPISNIYKKITIESEPGHYYGITFTTTVGCTHLFYTTANTDVTFRNILLDGGSESNGQSDYARIGYIFGSVTIADGTEIRNCKTGGVCGSDGGAFCLVDTGRMTMNGGHVHDCEAEKNGGFVHCHEKTSFVMTGGEIDHCSAKNGGAICLSDPCVLPGVISLTGGSIHDCSATENGGAVYASLKGSSVSLSNATIRDNKAGGNGGAIYMAEGTILSMKEAPTITGNEIKGSVNEKKGAGICLSSGSQLYLQGTPNFSDNCIADAGFAGENGGEEVSGKAYQDIYLADVTATTQAIQLSGPLTGEDGSIYVWAESENHYKKGTQFAVTQAEATESNLKAFRNARVDQETGNDTGSFLCGAKGTGNNVIWDANTVELTIDKTVTGAYADMTGSFEFAIDLPWEGNKTYSAQIYQKGADGESPVKAGKELTLSESKHTFALKNNQFVKIAAVPVGKAIAVWETGDKVNSSTGTDGKYMQTITVSEERAMLDAQANDPASMVRLKLKKNTTVNYTNTLEDVPTTGLVNKSNHTYLILAGILILLGLGVTDYQIRRRKHARQIG